MKKIIMWFSVMTICLSLFIPLASAAQGQQIEILFSDNGKYIEDAEFSVYNLGSVSGGTIIPYKTFSSYKVLFDISDSEKMSSLAETLWAYALRDDIAPDYTDRTDENGSADFGDIVFSEGAYLLTAKKHCQDGTYYFCKPVIIVIPYGKTDILFITPKFETVTEETQSLAVSYRVLKAWVQDEEGMRPVEIQVELLRDGEIYDTVVLNYKNNWRYQWDNLSAYNHWTVTEKTVVGDYVVALSSQEKAFLLTNSGNVGEDETTEPSEPTTSGTDKTTEPDKTTKPDKPSPEPEEELPVTGLLRWPAPYLAMAGILIFALGYIKYRKSENANEE